MLTAALLANLTAAPTDYGSNPAAAHTATVNGITLYFETYGTGAPLVVLHGNAGSISAMAAQIDFFRTHRRVIAIDSRGHGRSGLGNLPLTFELLADDVAALLGGLHEPPADVLGWSDGGIVALQLALRHPACVRRIALSGANLSTAAFATAELDTMQRDLAEARAKLAAGDPSRPWLTVSRQLELMIGQTPITVPELARIDIPALVMAGENDLIPPEHTRLIATALPKGRLHIFPGAGHGALQEVPDKFNAVVERFLQSPP